MDADQPFLPLEWPEPEDLLAQLREELAGLRAGNAATYQELTSPGRDGRRAVPDPLGVLALRVNIALEHLFADESARLRFDIEFELKMHDVLAECMSQRRQAELLAPLQQTPGPGIFLPKG